MTDEKRKIIEKIIFDNSLNTTQVLEQIMEECGADYKEAISIIREVITTKFKIR